MHTNIDYLAPNGAPDNDRKMKEASWLTGQAFIESLRYYPKGTTAMENHDCEATYSGCTHSARQVRKSRARHAACLAPMATPRLPPARPLLTVFASASAFACACVRVWQTVSEHIETDVRMRLGITPADQEWRDEQCPREWFPEKRPAMIKHMAKVRARLKR